MTKNAMRWAALLASGAAMLQFGGCVNDFFVGAVQGSGNPYLNIGQDVIIEVLNLGIGALTGLLPGAGA